MQEWSGLPMIVWPKTRLGGVLAKLEREYGQLAPPKLDGPFEMVLWEIVAYLADDAERAATFEVLRKRVGLTPKKILAAPIEQLAGITRMGGSIAYQERAERLQIAAQLVLDQFGGDLGSVMKLPAPKAKKLLMQFPMIGEPGAEKILLFCGVLDVLALESNGVRVLTRLGFGEEKKNYSATYKSVREVTLEEFPGDSKMLTSAHLLLRRHGQEVCLRSEPRCRGCVLASECKHARAEA